ncbi:MAG TPA: FAD-dependent oxidoreductase [Hyphomicrobiaceae bacterium]|nr:FAD-dependent oxidoreductase [Hyphomicrobiaceae bacterium]
MNERVLTPDLCVIGAGSGGLSVAAAAAALGVEVVLIEKHRMGGDCLNYGCVPSKALLAAGRRAHLMRTAGRFGIGAVEPDVNWPGVRAHVHGVIGAIAPNDSVERFAGMGVTVIQATAKFTDRRTVVAGDVTIRARRFVIATGSSPAVPAIPGLAGTPHFTNETLFDNGAPVGHLVVIGAGPIGLEMAQAHRRLGAAVTVLEGRTALGKDDPELAAIALTALRREGIAIREGVTIEAVRGAAHGVEVDIRVGGELQTIGGTHLLVAAGRTPNIEGLGLEAARIEVASGAVVVNRGLVTSNRRVFAIGDVTGGLQFTHVANAQAGIVIRRALFRLPAKFSPSVVPWVTYVDPELAQVGLREADAVAQHGAVNVYRWPFAENDRAQTEREHLGLVKIVTDKRGRILGAGMVGPHAGELIQLWVMAVSKEMKISEMTDWISPYPTLMEVNKRVAFRSMTDRASDPRVRKLIGFLRKFG